ncbi:putative Lysophospholipase, Monoglyceride lipase [Pseudonocardia sp. Ae168_Ps1]|nr:putative Lysophospholipase Monoglyceride lipase [Pseudonocardia sp. Ae150A_Ps1]OLL80792.1 putative Lysophospholipase, Monoglyceride lipase [Pseudonocardia sp. Ae168_Ps1]OLL85090.1 putative Lysophospholipase, Monoglyceride lipase [Pseudonocardia sp. Ae263_Ps1]OLL94893.1 putative Lysophospholipase, Monoglyceride lipase [Pseudonocardia sp. Ae356_Ps1]
MSIDRPTRRDGRSGEIDPTHEAVRYMSGTETFTFSGRDGTAVTAYRWLPHDREEVRGIVQLTHGMGEHALRYVALAAALTGRGFAVYAQDHRGHGATAGGPEGYGVLGDDGWDQLVADIGVLSAQAREEQPGVPLVLLGHSMGSFAVQQYLVADAPPPDAVVLSGTAVLDLMEQGLDLSVPMDLSSFNAPFEQRTGYEWLSRDTAQVDAYVGDARCGFGIDLPGTRAMFERARPLADAGTLRRIPGGLPVHVVVGDEDPVNGGLALVRPLTERYAAAGMHDVTLRIWPGARHEVFNETNRDEIVAELLTWLDRVVPDTRSH